MKKGKYSGSKLGGWDVRELIGSGGNADVYGSVKDNRRGAIKIPKKTVWERDKGYQRFTREIDSLERCQHIPGVIRLIDKNLPSRPSKIDPPFIVMALAVPIREAVKNDTSLPRIVEACHSIAATLKQVHELGFAHRDIKPANLFMHDQRWTIGDFGLVKTFDGVGITARGEKVGSAYYIAPEMLNEAVDADGRPADVYSLAKTLWVLGTNQNFPLEGDLKRTIPAMRMSTYVTHPFAPLLDPLLERSTQFYPENRPTMEEFGGELNAWLRPSTEGTPEELDLSRFEKRIRSLNEPYLADQERQTQEEAEIEAVRRQILTPVRALAQDIIAALKQAGFPKASTFADGDFSAAGTIHNSVKGKMGTLEFLGWLKLEPRGLATVSCQFSMRIRSGDTYMPKEGLWGKTVQFHCGGAEERPALSELVNEAKRALDKCVEKIIETLEDE